MKPIIRSGLLMLVLAACSEGVTPAYKVPAAKLERTALSDLATITLRADAAAAIKVTVEPVSAVTSAATIVVGGEVMVPAGKELVLAAPVGARIAGSVPQPGSAVKAGQVLMTLVPLATVDRDVRARAQREVEVAAAEVELAESRFKRTESMVADRSGSVRAFEDARAQRQVAAASLASANMRLQTLSAGALDSDVLLAVRSPADGVIRAVRAAAGQSVPSGAPLIEIASSGRWVRIALSSGDAVRTAGATHAWATRAGSGERLELSVIHGPPSSDPVRGTVDAFFALPASVEWSPGERLSVEIETSDVTSERLAVPLRSMVRDAEGGAWVYLQVEPLQFRRQRVEPKQLEGSQVVLERGPPIGTMVVVNGAIELWGHELGADR